AQLFRHRDDAVDRAGREAVGAAQIGQRVIGTVQVAGTVDQQQGLLTHVDDCDGSPRIVAMNASSARVRKPARMPRMLWIAACLSAFAGAQAQQQAPAPTTAPASLDNTDVAALEPRDRTEPNIKRTVIEDRGSKIEELRVRG